MGERLDAALALDALGWNIIPARKGGKAPAVDWKQWQKERSSDKLPVWFGDQGKEYNLWLVCGAISGVAVLDIDSDEGEAYWQERIGEQMLATTMVETVKGRHYYFKLAEGETWGSWSVHENGLNFDVRCEGSGVICPPSIHSSGKAYAWVRGPEHLVGTVAELRGPQESSEEGGGAGIRSLLVQELRRPPRGGDSGRNLWLTRIAGHYAKWIPFQDAYNETIVRINSGLDRPLSEGEARKVAKSIWRIELDQKAAEERLRGFPEERNGWLVEGPRRGVLYTTITTKDDDGDKVQALVPWADFSIKVRGVIRDSDNKRSYVVDLYTERERDGIRRLLDSSTLAREQALSVWLAGQGVSICAPPGDPRRGQVNGRLVRYLESQNGPELIGVDSLGWHEGIGFVCHEGIITADGVKEFETIAPNPRLRDWAKYKYGFEIGEEEAKWVLNEVLTYHDPVVCSVFGAWWAACFLKGKKGFGTALFPYVALEAPSESGKTRGFFSLLIALSGNTQGQSESTPAALRDQMSAHRNGPVWIDDMADVERVTDLLRQATSEGSRVKKSWDNTQQEVVKLVAPIVMSGESLAGILAEKAQRDRAVHLTARSPIERKSLHDPSRYQWDDVLELIDKYRGEFWRLSGTLVQMALRAGDLWIGELAALRGPSGRHNDKVAILRVGARVLAEMTGDQSHVERVDAWCAQQVDLGAENVLTTSILPELLNRNNMPRKPTRHPAVFVHVDGLIYYSETRVCAEWWYHYRGHKGRSSLVSIESLRGQREALGLKGKGKLFWTDRRQGLRVRYQCLDSDLSRRVIERSEYVGNI